MRGHDLRVPQTSGIIQEHSMPGARPSLTIAETVGPTVYDVHRCGTVTEIVATAESEAL